MRYFIDTNIFLFLHLDRDSLDADIRTLFEDYENSFVIGVDSIREIMALQRSGKVHSKTWRSFADIKASLDENAITIRYVDESHLKTLYALCPAPNHTDPVDLMIIAQAITEDLPLISSDKKFPLYRKQGLTFIPNKR